MEKIKRKLQTFAMTLLAVMAACVMPLAPVALVGCTGGCSTVAEGHDPIVVRAEQAADLSFEVFDSYLRLEEANRDYLRTVSPEFEKTANAIRVDGRAAIESLRSATKAYKNNRTPENKANVETWLRTVEVLRQTALKYIGQTKLKQ